METDELAEATGAGMPALARVQQATGGLEIYVLVAGPQGPC
jgi:hypothetical protein